MSLGPYHGQRSSSPASSGRTSPSPLSKRRTIEESLYKASKVLRRYGAIIERVLSSWENAPEEWAVFIAFLSRLLKAVQSHPTDCPFLPHSSQVAFKLAQCLNPTLPSGVHQKALEQDFLVAHLLDFLPGLSGVLAFASLSVRPAVYDIYEKYILQFPPNELRPALKSLLLSLLPAIEEENSEDFDRAFSIIDKLRKLSAQNNNRPDHSNEHGGIFWQCMFLCVITSPSRRQGALNYLSRTLPKTANGLSRSLPESAEVIVSPEPGLLVRAFVAALSDSQPLIQRGFLDLLASHLPLHSEIFDSRVEPRDLDRLMTATVRVLLRRDMSLNRRIWSWLLGPEPKEDHGDDAEAPSQAASQEAPSPDQFQYFVRHGRASLERCMLNLFRKPQSTAPDIAKAFRICLSLMDRWEIGGAIVPRLFLPAIETAFAYSQHASPSEVAEVLRSASLFFDGVEARLIWGNILNVVRDAFNQENSNAIGLRLPIWICQNFNVRDEDMISTHVPHVALYTLCLLNVRKSNRESSIYGKNVTPFLLQLLELMAVQMRSPSVGAKVAPTTDVSSPQEICKTIERFYEGRLSATTKDQLPLDSAIVPLLIVDRIINLLLKTLKTGAADEFAGAVSLLVKTNPHDEGHFPSIDELVSVVSESLTQSCSGHEVLAFSILDPIVTLVLALHDYRRLSTNQTQSLTTMLCTSLWPHLSPLYPSHHVEVVSFIWKLDQMHASDDDVKISLLSLLQQGNSTRPQGASKQECLRRFAVLWDHTISAQPLNRRRASVQAKSDSNAEQNTHRQAVLYEPLLVVLDALADVSDPGFEPTKGWLRSLPSLPCVVELLLQQLIALQADRTTECPDPAIAERRSLGRLREQGYILSHLEKLLTYVNQWCMQTMCDLTVSTTSTTEVTAIEALTKICCELLSITGTVSDTRNSAVSILTSILSSPLTIDIDYEDIEATLINELNRVTDEDDDVGQVQFLELAGLALKSRHARRLTESPDENPPKPSLTLKRQASAAKSGFVLAGAGDSFAPKLLACLRKGFSSPCSRRNLDQWLTFLARALPSFADALLPNLIPLVECLCAELEKAFLDIQSLTKSDTQVVAFLPDVAVVDLLEGLEMILAKAHGSLMEDVTPDQATKPASSASGFFGAVTTNVFRADGSASIKTPQNNSRLTVVLAFQDAVRVTLQIWAWATDHVEISENGVRNTATINHSAIKVRNKTRQFLENTFAAEPLEALEVIIFNWIHQQESENEDPALNLLHTMHGATPKLVLHTILDALCSRANPSAVPPQQISSQAIELSTVDIASFIIAFVESVDDDATEEIWNSCIAFLRDVLSNPLPYRQVLPLMLKFVLLLAQKLDNTNYGEPRKMRRELGDVFQRLLTATFTTMSTSQLTEAVVEDERSEPVGKSNHRVASDLLPVFVSIAVDIETIMENNDRIVATTNNISTHVLSPIMHAKAFPANVSSDALALLLQIAKKAPHAKSWKKELSDAFFDARFFSSKADLVEEGWFPVLNQWALRDRERMPDLLSRLTAPSSAGIMFGVGASAARLEADRRTQLNLRRIATLLMASPEDTYVALMPDFQVKLVELFDATHASSPSSVIKAELFMVIRALLLSISSAHIAAIWPIINESLKNALSCLVPDETHHELATFTNLSLVQACKLLDLLITISPDEFQLHEWLYITDTIDAVYHPPGWMPMALSDRIAESLGASNGDESHSLVSSIQALTLSPGKRRPLLQEVSFDKEDIKALSQQECARLVLRPFLSQLSILAYEGVYSMEEPDSAACRRNLLEDVLDVATMIE